MRALGTKLVFGTDPRTKEANVSRGIVLPRIWSHALNTLGQVTKNVERPRLPTIYTYSDGKSMRKHELVTVLLTNFYTRMLEACFKSFMTRNRFLMI